MRLLLDTHLLLWLAEDDARLPGEARDLAEDPENEILFSVASIWELAIKQTLGRSSYLGDTRVIHRELLRHRYLELSVTGAHAIAVIQLPLIHKDPFDRILVAQSIVEAVTLVTSDPTVAKYPCPIRLV